MLALPSICGQFGNFHRILITLHDFHSFSFRNRNLDALTETYGLSFYMQYLAHWPEYFQVAESPSGEIMGYSTYLQQLSSTRIKYF